MPTLLPISTVSNIGWALTGGASLHAVLSDSSDSSYASTNSSTGGGAEVKLSSGTDPITNTGFIIHVRSYMTGSSADLIVELKQGASTVKSSTITLSGSVSEFTITLSDVEASAITDFTDLRIYVSAGGGDIGGNTIVTEVSLFVPELTSGSFTQSDTSMGSMIVFMRDKPAGSSYCQNNMIVQTIDGFRRWPNNKRFKGADPIDEQDAMNGGICSLSGQWFPGSHLVTVNGKQYGRKYAPSSTGEKPNAPIQ